MLPTQHAAYGGLASLALLPVLKRQSVTMWAASVLIDTDHYVWYAIKKRDLSLLRAYRYFRTEHYDDAANRQGLLPDARILHGPVNVSLLGLLACFVPPLRAVFLGVLVHSLLDAYAERRLNPLLPAGWRLTP